MFKYRVITTGEFRISWKSATHNGKIHTNHSASNIAADMEKRHNLTSRSKSTTSLAITSKSSVVSSTTNESLIVHYANWTRETVSANLPFRWIDNLDIRRNFLSSQYYCWNTQIPSISERVRRTFIGPCCWIKSSENGNDSRSEKIIWKYSTLMFDGWRNAIIITEENHLMYEMQRKAKEMMKSQPLKLFAELKKRYFRYNLTTSRSPYWFWKYVESFSPEDVEFGKTWENGSVVPWYSKSRTLNSEVL